MCSKGSDYVIYSHHRDYLQESDPVQTWLILAGQVWYVVSECQLMVGVSGDEVSCFGAGGEGRHVSTAPAANFCLLFVGPSVF